MSSMETIMQSKTALAGGGLAPFSETLPYIKRQSFSFSEAFAAIKSKWAVVDRWQREKEAIELLHQMDDHILSDIGIRRQEIEFIVRNGRRPDAEKS